ncbi:hypothetical protein [Adhaeribacter arboris]|nr:hypothetical protein [Adhaeribacter arboris]
MTLSPIFPLSAEYKSELIIYEKFNGFLGACCYYEVREPKVLLFEKTLGVIDLDDPYISFRKLKLNEGQDSIIVNGQGIKLQ